MGQIFLGAAPMERGTCANYLVNNRGEGQPSPPTIGNGLSTGARTTKRSRTAAKSLSLDHAVDP